MTTAADCDSFAEHSRGVAECVETAKRKTIRRVARVDHYYDDDDDGRRGRLLAEAFRRQLRSSGWSTLPEYIK